MSVIYLFLVFLILPASAEYNYSNITIGQAYDSSNGTYSDIPNGTGFDELFKADNLCVSGSCAISDAITWIDRYINLFWWIGMGLVVYRYKMMGRR